MHYKSEIFYDWFKNKPIFNQGKELARRSYWPVPVTVRNRGGLLPATVFALSAAKGDIYYGLWYPIIIAAMSLVIGLLFVRDNKKDAALEDM